MNINFGNKEISIKEWKGKERRLLQRSIDDESLTPALINKILIKDCMDNNVYLSSAEINFVYFSQYKECFSNDLNVEFQCPECAAINKQLVNVQNLLDECEISKLDVIDLSQVSFKFGIPSYSEEVMSNFDEKLINTSDKVYYNMLISIESVIVNGELKDKPDISYLDELIESLSISDFDKLMTYFTENSFKFMPVSLLTCKSCAIVVPVMCDYLTELLK